eukprot:4639200-Amphidinium_carterae.1
MSKSIAIYSGAHSLMGPWHSCRVLAEVVAAPPTPEPTMEPSIVSSCDVVPPGQCCSECQEPAANEPFLVIVQNKQGVRLGFGVGHVTGQDALYVVSVGG